MPTAPAGVALSVSLRPQCLCGQSQQAKEALSARSVWFSGLALTMFVLEPACCSDPFRIPALPQARLSIRKEAEEVFKMKSEPIKPGCPCPCLLGAGQAVSVGPQEALQADSFWGLGQSSPCHCKSKGCSAAFRKHLYLPKPLLEKGRVWSDTEVL